MRNRHSWFGQREESFWRGKTAVGKLRRFAENPACDITTNFKETK
jgi:hypothetical protein